MLSVRIAVKNEDMAKFTVICFTACILAIGKAVPQHNYGGVKGEEI
jgi:hypothetical protein